MSNSPQISVSIVNYNFEKYIGLCIESILNQTLLPSEIIITDDCSSDRSWEIIEAYKNKFPTLIKAVRQPENKGPYYNGTLGYKMASGDYLSAIDGDDTWHPQKLEREWKALQRNTNTKIAYSNVQIIDPEGTEITRWVKPEDPAPPQGDVFARVFGKQFFSGRKSVFRNELIDRCVYDEFVHDHNVPIHLDWDFKIRTTAVYEVGYTNEALVQYRDHGGGISKTDPMKMYQSANYVISKNLPLLQGRPPEDIAMVLNGTNELLRILGAKANMESVQQYALANTPQTPAMQS